jgi:hypothetical protein
MRKGSQRAISDICVISQQLTAKFQFGSTLLPNCRGAITSFFSISSEIRL